VPSLHGAVLDHQLDIAAGGVVDQGWQLVLGELQVVGDRPPGVTADERAHEGHPERVSGVDARPQVAVGPRSFVLVTVQVVGVVGDGGEGEVVTGEQLADLVGVGCAEGLGVDVGGLVNVAAPRWPRRHLEGVVAGVGGPGSDLLQGQMT
jgi:hypothetical protein